MTGLQFEPISLGGACAAKFQICRTLYQRAFAQGTVERLREVLLFKRAAEIFPRHILDWQITPLSAAIAYLEEDFYGVFERDDLFVDEDGVVVHRRLGTRHPHDFHGAYDGPMDEPSLDAQYPAARAKFEYLAQKFRDHLSRRGPFLYVRSGAADRDQAQRLIGLLSRSPSHDFRILFAETEGSADLSHLDPRADHAVLPGAIDKPGPQQWEGDDGDWDRMLAPFDIGLPRGPAFTCNLNPVEPIGGDLTRVGLEWRTPPTWSLAGALPQTFAVPSAEWDYAAVSSPVDGLAATAARTLYVTVQAVEGKVGVLMTRPDGSDLVGPEYCVSSQEGMVRIPLKLSPGMGPASILLRNHGEADVAGAARVHAVDMADTP